VSRAGDLWCLGRHRIGCGDARDGACLEAVMAARRAQMVLTDPPYNVPITGHVCGNGAAQHPEFAMASGEMSEAEFEALLSAVLVNLLGVSDSTALHYVFMDWRHIRTLLTVGEAHYAALLNLCVWAKTNGGMGSLYRSQHELIAVLKVGTGPHVNNVQLGRHGRNRTNVWTCPGVNSFGEGRNEALAMHPTVKPVALLADAILDVTHRGDVVLDPFLGSGSTLMAAERTARACCGLELEPRYVDVALRRWMAATGEPPRLAPSGEPFDRVADARLATATTED
jgi:DNA modification methylase